MGLWGKVRGKDKYWERRREEERRAAEARRQQQIAMDQQTLLAGSSQVDSDVTTQAGGEAIAQDIDMSGGSTFKKKKRLSTVSGSLGIM